MKQLKLLTVLTFTTITFTYIACSNSAGSSSPSASNTSNSGGNTVSSGNTQSNNGNQPDSTQNGGNTNNETVTNTSGGTGGESTGGQTGGTQGENNTGSGLSYGSAGQANGTSVMYVEFGSWPQTKYTGDTSAMSTDTSIVNGWIVHTGPDNKYYVEDGGNYYKIEPIKWRILTNSFDHDANENTPGKKLLLAENVLTAIEFYDEMDFQKKRKIDSVYKSMNNYEHSRVRAFLNGLSYIKISGTESSFENNGFLQKAFTAAERDAIAITKVVNDERSTKPDTIPADYDDHNNTFASDIKTEDKIFILSRQEVSKTDFQFDVYNEYDSTAVTYGTGNKRIRLATDYAKDKGAAQSDTSGYGATWFLRSPLWSNSSSVGYVEENGNSSRNEFTSNKCGIVPALCLE